MDKYLLQRPSNHVYVWSEHLAKRKDMWSCDIHGNIIQPKAEQLVQDEPAFVQVDFESMTKYQIETYIMERYKINMDLRHSKMDMVAEANKIVESIEV